jgi:hypothetical protein
MEIEENVNPGMGKREVSKIPFDYRKNKQSQIVVCHSEAVEKPALEASFIPLAF